MFCTLIFWSLVQNFRGFFFLFICSDPFGFFLVLPNWHGLWTLVLCFGIASMHCNWVELPVNAHLGCLEQSLLIMERDFFLSQMVGMIRIFKICFVHHLPPPPQKRKPCTIIHCKVNICLLYSWSHVVLVLNCSHSFFFLMWPQHTGQ